MAPLCYRRHRFPPEIIQHAIWLYLRFTLSYRDVEELLAERGLDISYETVRRWVLKFGPAIARRLRRRDVGLDTHIADVANLMIWENLRDVVLVGHSYGGVVVRHVADRMPERIRSLVYLDAFVPDNGQALFDYLPDDGKSDRELAMAHGDGWKVPPRPASFFGVNAADADWVDRQCTMHPLSSFAAPARISGACDDIATIGYILARGFDSPFEQFYAKAGERRWWQAELACGHDVMLDRPNELTALLLQRT